MKGKSRAAKSNAAKTKQKIKSLYARYEETARQNKIVWNEEKAGKLYKQAKKEKTPQKELFKKKLEKSFQSKSYYVKKKFKTDIKEAREIVNEYLINNIKYDESPLVVEREIIKEPEAGTISGVTSFMFIKEYLAESVETVSYNGVEYTLAEFFAILPEIKEELEEQFDELGINTDYSRSILFLNVVEFKNSEGETTKLEINTFEPEEILGKASELQGKNSDWNLLK